jgi:hypothetical protein
MHQSVLRDNHAVANNLAEIFVPYVLFNFVFLFAGIQAENGRYGEYSHQKIMQKSGKSSSTIQYYHQSTYIP